MLGSRYFSEFNRASKLELKSVSAALNCADTGSCGSLKTFLIKSYLLELGKLNKSRLINRDSTIELDEFIISGLRLYSSVDLSSYDYYDRLHILKFSKAVKAVLDGDLRP